MSERKDRLNRREFFSKTLAGLGSASFLLTGRKASAGAHAGGPAASPAGSPAIIHRPLGKTGIRLPVVNMGVMNADNPDLVRRSFELGVRHFDTAESYARGRNEEMVGTVIQELKARDRVVIATKISIGGVRRAASAPAEIKSVFLNRFEGCLKRLKTDYVDVLYLHNVQSVEDIRDPGFTAALAQLKKEKKARFVGFSVHGNMTELLNEAARGGFYDVLLVAYNYAMAEDAELEMALRGAAGRGIGLIAMKTQCAQYWYRDDYVPKEKQGLYSGVHQTAVLKWALRNDYISCAVPGYTTFAQMEEDFSVARDLDLTPDEKKFLESRSVRLALAYCVQCRKCLKTCPAAVDVPSLMRAHLYASIYGNHAQARDTLESVPGGIGLSACGSCPECSVRCARNIQVGRRIGELKTLCA